MLIIFFKQKKKHIGLATHNYIYVKRVTDNTPTLTIAYIEINHRKFRPFWK